MLEDISDNIQNKLGGSLHAVILYGSYARGDYDDESDIDIMVLAETNENDTAPREIADEISNDMSLKYDMLVSIIIRPEDLFYERVSFVPFYRNVANEGIFVYGTKRELRIFYEQIKLYYR